MTTKPKKTMIKPVIENAAGGKIARKRATKNERLVQLLKARSGCDIVALSGKLGWRPHSTRAALSRLRKAGHAIEKLPPQKNGTSRYRITNAAPEVPQ